MNSYETKIIPPQLKGTVPRERLFRLLDEKGTHPITWVSSPAGSGKTTLVASYVQERKIPTLWYRVDETDGDVAGFFYYMGKAAKHLRKGRAKHLPLFTPEYRLGITAFTRHYFECLFGKMQPPAMIIFDNYQDAPEGAEFHEVLGNGLKIVPDGIRVLLVSRKEYPPPFVSLKAESMLSSIGWEDIRFTMDEVREIVRLRKKETTSEELVIRIYEETQGWAAAVILMLDNDAPQAFTPKSIGHSSIFTYFTIEVFRRLNPRIKDFLFITSLLPSVSPEIASTLTGVEESETILAHLNRNNYFTDRYGHNYQYHPLFKEFLLDEARKRYSADELVSLTVRASRLLAQSGRTEEAVGLLLDAGAFPETLPLILAHAQTLLTHGRGATLEEWAGKLPEEMQETTPWLLYWLGIGQLLTNPTEARQSLEKAFRLFEDGKDKTGSLISVAGIINSIMLEWDDYRRLDPWMEWMDRHVDAETPLPVPEVEIQVASAMVLGLTWRMFWHPSRHAWIKRTLAASREVKDIAMRLTAKGHIMEHYGFLGHWAEMRLVAEEFRQTTVSSEASPLVHLARMVRIIETHDWVHGSWEDTYGRLCKSLQLAEKVGVCMHLGMTLIHGVWIAFEMGNLQLAGEFLQRMEQSAFKERNLGRAFYHSIASLFYLQKGDTISAHQNADMGVKASVQAGVPIMEAWSRVALAYALRRQGQSGPAGDQLAMAERIVVPVGTTHVLYLVRLTQTSLLLDEGNEAKAVEVLEEGLRIGRERGYAMTLFWYWQPDEMARLCMTALVHNIEMEYTRTVIRKCRLRPNMPPEKIGVWPWLCRIRTLGSFKILVNDEPLIFSGKVQKKPLALLKALIALGGREVREDTIEDRLWPEAEGDMAHIALKTTLSRLRRLLGNERMIEVHEGKVSLNGRFIWLDTWTMESLADRTSELWQNKGKSKKVRELEELSSLVIDLYRGEFLAGDDDEWVNACRISLRERSVKIIEKLGKMLDEAGEREKAEILYEHRLHTDKAKVKETG